jgi:AcrR family transcriptional regulator
MKSSRFRKAAAPKRLQAHERRSTILQAANRLLSERGSEGVQVNEVAREAGVTRPIVYKFFPSRDALLQALLSDMEATLQEKMTQALVRVATAQLSDAVRAMVEACCDAIEEKGSGAWTLLDARGTDPELAKLGAAIHARLLAPWHPLIRKHTGLKPKDTELLLHVVVAAGRAALDPWLEHTTSRARAVEAATRAVRALIFEFTLAKP